MDTATDTAGKPNAFGPNASPVNVLPPQDQLIDGDVLSLTFTGRLWPDPEALASTLHRLLVFYGPPGGLLWSLDYPVDHPITEARSVLISHYRGPPPALDRGFSPSALADAPTANRSELERECGNANYAAQLRHGAFLQPPNTPTRLDERFIAWRGMVWSLVRLRKPATCEIIGEPLLPGVWAWRQLSEVKGRDMRVSQEAWRDL